MEMSNKIPTITEVKNADETNRWLLIWQGLTDMWSKLVDAFDRIEIMEISVKKHEQLLISGTEGDPPLMERVRNLEKLAQKMERISNTILLQTFAFLFTMLGVGISFFVKIYPVLVKLADKP